MKNIREILEQGPVEASAPCRIDMGGTLDLSTFYLPLRDLSPCTFNAALAMRTRVRLSPYEKGKVKVLSRGFDEVEADSGNAPFDSPVGLMLAVGACFQADGILIEIDSASPPRSALGGSSVAAVALIWAFGKALAQAGRPMPRPDEAALLAHAIEQGMAGATCGMQDQLAAAFGGVNCWNWQFEAGAAPFARQVLETAGDIRSWPQQLLVAYCGRPHESRNINGLWVREFVSGSTRSIWREIAECSRRFVSAVGAGDLGAAVAEMNHDVDLRCRITPEVLDETGRLLVIAARSHGCGARFTGAGGGGCVWALGGAEDIGRLRPVWEDLLAGQADARLLAAEIDDNGVL